MEREAEACATVPRRMKKCLWIPPPGPVHSREFSLQQNKEVVYLGFDFPSELEVRWEVKSQVNNFFILLHTEFPRVNSAREESTNISSFFWGRFCHPFHSFRPVEWGTHLSPRVSFT
ncbi:hypothetical protein CEXT_410231 [Caerostris extrusa]|uniref:Uncharacterized protein n=1 Tax=Caerostris extrusa TaxID=172846 RepID=A0AAV4TGX1_CAEEX|nr:hypothetical protein CEXT_410231 [Caerostris extrusa]